MTNRYPTTNQESPWGAEVLDCSTKSLKNLKFRKIAEFLLGRQGKLLEIGCGRGKMIRSLHRLNANLDYTGCDISDDAIEFCQRSCPYANFFVANAEDVHVEGEYDYVMLPDILEHVADHEKVLENARAALKEDGHLILITATEGEPNMYSLLRLIKKDWSLETRGHRHYFTKKGLFTEIERHFEIERVEYLYHVLGSTFDALLFFATLNTRVRDMFWRSGMDAEGKTSPFRKIVTVFDVIAYYESILLKDVGLSSSVQFTVARKRISRCA